MFSPDRSSGYCFGERLIATEKKQTRINGEINCPEVRLVGVEGEQLGIVKVYDALASGRRS